MSSGSGPLFLGPDVAAEQVYTAQPTRPSQPNDKGGQGEDFGKSSPVGLLVLLLFFIAVAFLVRSMTKHLKRVPASFDKPEDEAAAEPEPADTAEEKPADDSAEAEAEKK
jgi:hypothetical protein